MEKILKSEYYNRRFGIASIPRSGSAWLSTVMNLHPDVRCYHELVCDPICDDVEKWLMEDLVDYKFVGDACGTYLTADRLIPKRIVYIERDEEDCRISSEVALEQPINDAKWSNIVRASEAFRLTYNPFVIDFDDLFTIDGVIRTWGVLTDALPPIDKIRSLLGLRIQLNDLHHYDMTMVQKNLRKLKKKITWDT